MLDAEPNIGIGGKMPDEIGTAHGRLDGICGQTVTAPASPPRNESFFHRSSA
jgi:hypothetical protein